MRQTTLQREDASPLDTDDPVAQALQFLLDSGRAGWSLTMAMRARLGDLDPVTNLPIVVVTKLYLDGSLRPVELQRLIGMTSGGTTKLLDRLEHAGLIRRSHGGVPSDRRAIEVRLTPKGRRMAVSIGLVVIERSQDVATTFRRLSEEAEQLAAITPADRAAG